jgi:hypothetical protein
VPRAPTVCPLSWSLRFWEGLALSCWCSPIAWSSLNWMWQCFVARYPFWIPERESPPPPRANILFPLVLSPTAHPRRPFLGAIDHLVLDRPHVSFVLAFRDLSAVALFCFFLSPFFLHPGPALATSRPPPTRLLLRPQFRVSPRHLFLPFISLGFYDLERALGSFHASKCISGLRHRYIQLFCIFQRNSMFPCHPTLHIDGMRELIF